MPRMQIGRILVPTDLGQPNPHAFACARLFAERLRAHVDVVCAVPVLARRTALSGDGDGTPWTEKMEARLRKEVAIQLGPLVSFDVRVVEGDPFPMIIRMAEELRSDLVVIGSRGLRGWRRSFLGSLTSKILQATARPLLAVKLIDDGNGCLLFWRPDPADRIRRLTLRKEDLLRWHQTTDCRGLAKE